MAWYSFAGNNALGNPIQGQCYAESELELTGRLHVAGISAVSTKKLPFLKVCLLNIKNVLSRFYPVKKMDLALFYYQLADLLEVDIPLKNALFVIANHLNNPRLVRVIHDVMANLSRGLSFSEALSKHQRLFSAVTVRLISFAQSKQELMAILYYCDQAMRRSTFAKRVVFVAMPQLSLTLVFFMVLLFLRERYLVAFNYAIYVFREPTPIVIRLFDTITGLFSVHILKTISVIFLMVFGVKLLIALSSRVKLFYHALLCYCPIVSGVILAVERERLSLLYSVLLKGGASAQKCAQCSIAVVTNLFFRRRVSAMSATVQQGESFSNTLQFFHIFNAAEVQMITLGAVSNSLVKAFERIYSVSQIMLERRLLLLIEFTRLCLYILNSLLFFFAIYVTETLFYYPGSAH
jgi:type IV pilus assembly protein PilC